MIPIRNIYYMLSYAFRVLKEDRYKKLATEEFHNTAELFAAILARGVSLQVRRGLGREYIERVEPLSSPRGTIEISESIKTLSLHRKRPVCTHDDFSVNSPMNRIVKTTMIMFLRADISAERKKELRRLLVFFADVDTLDPHDINWNFRFHRNNETYRMLIAICSLAIRGLLQSNTDGDTRLLDFTDEQKARLYERFVLEYYRKEIPILSAEASRIPWGIDDGMTELLPTMQSDITLEYRGKVLIIDAKYYSRSTQERYGAHTVHSGHLYQIFTYVKNKQIEPVGEPREVAGMLLYAQTDEEVLPNNTKPYLMGGNKIFVRTLDLNCDFVEIARQLDGMAEEYFEFVV